LNMRKAILLVSLILVLLTGIGLGSYWIHTQPIWVCDSQHDPKVLSHLPNRNKLVVDWIETHGTDLAPTYEEAVCTEFVINVLDHFGPLSKDEKRKLRIITQENIIELLNRRSSVIRGVQTALYQSHRGIIIERAEDVRPGDFVQIWNVYQGQEYGHCGIVFDIVPHQSLTLYSSHPLTGGYGKQQYLWPDQAYFVRLK